MKKNSFTLPFKSNFFKEQDPFHLVIVFFIVFFGTAIFFSVPTFYDYKKYNQQIENTINREFKINIENLENISFRFIPSPHLLIKKANLKIKSDEKNPISELKNIKLFISITDLYKNDDFKIKRMVINKANFYLNDLSLLNIINNLKKNIVNNLIVKNSTIFFKDKKDEIILISKISELDYYIDYVNSKKIFKIIGNVFDTDFTFKYLIDYKNHNIQDVNLEFKNPNLVFQNRLIQKLDVNEIDQKGNLTIKFLNQKNNLEYELKRNQIKFIDKDLKNSNFDLNGSIFFNPFHFDLLLDIKKINLSELENLLYLIFKNQDLKFENLSGFIKLDFNNINNKFLKNGYVDLKFENNNLYDQNKIFNLNNFATLEIEDYEYSENIDQLLKMKVKINILDQNKFNRFLFNYKKNKIEYNKIFLTYQYNVNNQTSFISKISNTEFVNSSEFYKFKNWQQLKNILQDDNLFKWD